MANSKIQLHPAAEKKTLWAWTLGTFFGAGFLKPGPGTYGSIAALLLWYVTAHTLNPSPAALAIGTAVAARESGREDPGHVVIDEAAGQLIALIAIPADWKHAALSLLLFRAFDILKPPPIRQLERLPAGTGIMLDDVAAGLFALACAQLARIFF